MNVRKRGLALLMCICMIFTLLPFSALADATAKDGDIVYGKYGDDGKWKEDKTLTAEKSVKHYPASGETSDNDADIDYSKTAVKNDDGSYNVTLTIKSKTSETAPGASAVVLVIDSSGSMEGGKLEKALDAAKSFADSYGKTAKSGRYIAAVEFSNKASSLNFGTYFYQNYWLDVANTDNLKTFKNKIDNWLEAGGGTDLAYGLQMTDKRFTDKTVKNISNRYAVVLTDGKPESYYDDDPEKTATEAATQLRNKAEIYTVGVGLTEYTKNFLENSIASKADGKTYAYNVNNANDLNSTFTTIFQSIEQGISSGFTVIDPMGEYVNLDSASLTGNGASVNNGTITWEPKNGDTVTNDDGSKTTTYTLTYKVTLGEVPEDGTYPLNKDTTLKFKDGETAKTLHFNVPGVYREAPKYMVTYKYANAAPEGAPDLATWGGSYNKDATVTVADKPSVDGWTFSGWELANDSTAVTGYNKGDTSFTMPAGDVKFVGTWSRNTANYTVRYYWNGQPIPGVDEMTRSADVGTKIDNISKNIDGYTVKDGQPTDFVVSATASENIITINYYKDVKVSAGIYEKNVGDDLTDVGATVVGVTDGTAINYTLTGVPKNSNTAGEYPLNVSGDEIQGEYKVTYIDGKLTIYDTYTVTYKYEYTDGTPVPETVTAPVDSNSPYREGAIVNVAAAPVGTAIPGYTFTGWFAEDGTQITAKTFEMPNKNVVITGKWEPADTTYTIECYWGYDNQNKLPADTDGQVFSGKVGQKINLIDTPTITGYTACMSDVIKLKASGNVLKVYYLKNVTITPGNATVTYDGEEHFVNTFSATTIDGDATETMAQYIYAYVAGTNAGVYPVGVFHKASEGNPLAATDEVPAAIALNVNDQIGGRYCVTEIGEGNLTINRAKVTVTADDKSKYVGEKDPKFTTTIEGLVKGESESLIDYTIKRDPGEKAGTYKIIPVGDKEQGNYEVTFKNGNLTIKSRPVNPGIYTEIIVEITGNSDSVVYDGTEHSVKDYTVKISDPRYTEKDFTFTGKAEASGVNAGTYEMGLKAEQFRNTNALFRNVKFVIKADGVLTITPKDLTITAGSKTEYGPTPVTCDEWTVSGLAAGDKVESVKITGIQSVPGSSPNVPSDAVIKNAKGEDVTKNYAIKYVNGTLTMLEVLNKEDHFNYIIGTPEGLSLPTANVTRAEVATIFFRLMTDDARAKFDSLDNNFSDVAKGQWYNRAISTLANAGIIKGDPAGTYRPGDPITRAEMATIIARFGDFKEGGKTFNDISGHWAQKYIELAASNGWINGNPDGTFKPNNNITRAETVAMINRVLDRQTKDVSDLLPVSQMTNWSDNMDTAKWYYRDMQEATNNHKAERVGNSIYEKWTEKLPDIDWASYQI